MLSSAFRSSAGRTRPGHRGRVDLPNHFRRAQMWVARRRAGVAVLALVPLFAAPPTAAAQFFSPTSVWNSPLDPTAPVDPNSSTMIGELTREATQWGAWINTTQYSTPIYTVPATQP